MQFNRIKNYKSFTAIKELWFASLFLITAMLTSFHAAAVENTQENKLVGISYNTIQTDQIELVFSFSESISSLPEVNTSSQPAYVEISFDADLFDDEIKNTLINHAGITDVSLDGTSGNVVAQINLEKLAVFDVALNDTKFAITFNYGDSARVVEALSPAGEDFINTIKSIDFRLNENDEAQVLVYLDKSTLAADVNNKLGKANIEFHNTEIPDDLLYKLDVTDFGTIVTGIETFKEGRNARLVVDVSEGFTFSQNQEENLFTLTLSKIPEKAPAYLGETDDFTGRSISLNFQDIPVRTVLQIIADYNEFNLITSDTVTGNITLRA